MTMYVIDVSKNLAPIKEGARLTVVANSPTALSGLKDGSLQKFPNRVMREAHYGIPVLMSSEVYEDAVHWSRPSLRQGGHLYNEDTRNWDILWMAKPAATQAQNNPGEKFGFEVSRVPNTESDGAASQQTLSDHIDLTIELMVYDRSGKACLVVNLSDKSSL